MGERQLVAVRIGHVEVALLPGGVSRDLRVESSFFQMGPESVHIRDVEDQPPSAGHPVALFQIEDRRSCVFCAQRGEASVLLTIEKLHAQNISIKPHGSAMFATRRVTAEILSIVGAMRLESTSAALECSLQQAYR
jgi:hypothetical protein